MKRHWIEYHETPPDCPMTFWVHRAVAGVHQSDPFTFDPPRQPVVPARGYPVFKVECDGFTFEFASFAEIRACIETLSTKLLPRTLDLSKERGAGPNSHWLSRLPKDVKSWRYREKATAYFRKALEDFERDIG